MMTTTYHPATNVYAHIAAIAAAPVSPPPRRLARISLAPVASEPSATVALRAEAARRRASLLADYEAAFPALRTRGEHGALVVRLAREHDMTRKYVTDVTAEWRQARGLRVPIYANREN